MDIDSISGHDFEDLVEKLIKHLGFITEERKRSADGGIDIRAINVQPIFKGLYIIQCKRYSNTISESTIRDLYGVVSSERANKGILITNSTFSKAAEKFASNKPLELIDGNKLIELFEKHLNKSFEKESEKNLVPEKFKITFEFLDAGIKRINKRRQDIIDKRIYLGSKFYNNEQVFINYVQEKNKKMLAIVEVLANQLSNLNNIWNNFSENQGNYKNIQELKNNCSEIIKTINLVEKEQEELISITPPNNLIEVHAALINIYNPIFKGFSELLNKLSLLINNPEEPSLVKHFENGKRIVDLNFKISINDEVQVFTRKFEEYNKSKLRELQKLNKTNDKRCYVATVIYKDVDAPEVMQLRQWRDNVLCKRIFGRLIIKIYYFFGKYLANHIDKFSSIKKITKYFLDIFIQRLKPTDDF